MAPSASMLFLSYHQLHAATPAAETPQKEKKASPRPGEGGGVRFSVSRVFSLDAFARRRDQPAPFDQGKKVVGCKRDAAEEKPPAAELDEKFEEALRLSCWSA